MKTAVALLLLLALPASGTFAGEIYGNITHADKALGDSIKVDVVTSNKTTYTTFTDKFGAYRIFVKEKGKCTLMVHYNEQRTSVELFSYDRSTRYDWILEEKEGKYSIRRK